MEIKDILALESVVSTFLIQNNERKNHKNKLIKKLKDTETELKNKEELLDLYERAAALLAAVSDDITETTLRRVTEVINKALGVLFTKESRTVTIRKELYRDIYPHFLVELTTGSGKVRTFKQSGAGLGQIVSFLFTICLIDVRKGRKIFVADELLNGLHYDAKDLLKGLILALSDRFQFLVIEHGLDLGTEYEVKKTGTTSSVSLVEKGTYYADLMS